MNRTDRLFALIVHLQRAKRIRAVDLAETFEVSKRTIYRDIAALSEAGVPVVSFPGAGYALMEGFFLPPLVFSVSEASALILGARLLAQQASGRTAQGARQAIAKITAVLPADTRVEVERLSDIIEFFAPAASFDLDDPRLSSLQDAIRERRVVHLRYLGYADDEPTEREVEPHHLIYSQGWWYLSGFCRLRGGTRSFRLSRIEELRPLPETFAPRGAAVERPGAQIEVRVRVGAAVSRRVRERQHYGFVGEALAGDELADVIMTYRVDAISELMPWLLQWGADVDVLGPPDLREQMLREAQRLFGLLSKQLPAIEQKLIADSQD